MSSFSKRIGRGRKIQQKRNSTNILTSAADFGLILPQLQSHQDRDRDSLDLKTIDCELDNRRERAISVDSYKDIVQNDRIFCYKIVHDLRHPTEALVLGLKALIEENRKGLANRLSHLIRKSKVFSPTPKSKK